MHLRIGFGYDIHKLGEGGDLVIGGVCVKKGIHSIAHSDGDILAHAIIDALLGAAGLKDIGAIFPENEKNRNMDSMRALLSVKDRILNMGYEIVNLDSTVVCSVIKLSPFREKIVDNLQNTLKCNVSVKFKSGNGVGDVGKGKAIEAFAVVLIASKY